MDTKLQQLIAFLTRYAIASQSRHAQPAEAQVKIDLLAKDTTISIYYLIPGVQLEPTGIGIGDYLVKEALAAIDILTTELPNVKVRFVNVTTLSWSGFGSGGTGSDSFENSMFVALALHNFTRSIFCPLAR